VYNAVDTVGVHRPRRLCSRLVHGRVHIHVHNPYMAIYTAMFTAVFVAHTRLLRPCTGHVHLPPCTRPVDGRVHGGVHGPCTRPCTQVVPGRDHAHSLYRPCTGGVQAVYMVLFTACVHGRVCGTYTAVYAPCKRVMTVKTAVYTAMFTTRTRPINGCVHGPYCTQPVY